MLDVIWEMIDVRKEKVILLGFLILVLAFGGIDPDSWAGSGEEILTVACPDPEGCFRLIEQAIAAAQPGGTVRIAPGLYYEKPLVIDKNLTLEDAGERWQTTIRFVDQEPGLTIRLADDQRPVRVSLRRLTFVTPGLMHVWDFSWAR